MRTCLLAILLTLAAPLPGARPIGRSRAVRPGGRRPRRSGQAGRCQGHDRALLRPNRDRHQILQAGVAVVAPGAVPLGRAYAANHQNPEAIAAWRKAADKGSSSAMVELGVLYGTGAGVAKDEAQARKLFERRRSRQPPRHHPISAALGGAVAAADPAQARACWQSGRNLPEAQYQLGVMLVRRHGRRRTTSRRGRCSRRRRHKIIPARWSGWAPSRWRAAAAQGHDRRQGR